MNLPPEIWSEILSHLTTTPVPFRKNLSYILDLLLLYPHRLQRRDTLKALY